MKDVLIIGQGIAGTVLAHELLQRDWDIHVVDEYRAFTASKIASGLYNPLVLKRRRVVWQAKVMLDALLEVYPQMERMTQRSFLHHKPVWEVLPDPGTENEWIHLEDQPKFKGLIGEIKPTENLKIRANKVGEVAGSGKVDTGCMIEGMREYLIAENRFSDTFIETDDLNHENGSWHWRGMGFKHIIWCEGFDKNNAHFPGLPFSPTKGEVLIVKAPELKLEHILHGNMFIMPLGNDHYKIGATYSWDPLDTIPTQDGRTKLLEAWNKLVDCPCEVVEHLAGIRPNVKDRKPLIGTSAIQENAHLFNGMGSRGILMAPWLARQFADYLIKGTPLPSEVDVNRFS